MFRQLGPAELIIIFLIVVLLFGAKKLPETARGLGRSLRIFKAETKGLVDDEGDATSEPPAPKAVESGRPEQVQPHATTSAPETDRTDR